MSKGDEEFLCNDEDDTNFMCNLARKKKVICGITNYIDPFTIVERLKNMVTGSNNSQEGGKLPKFNPRYLKNVKTNNSINSKKPPVNNTMGVKLKKNLNNKITIFCKYIMKNWKSNRGLLITEKNDNSIHKSESNTDKYNEKKMNYTIF